MAVRFGVANGRRYWGQSDQSEAGVPRGHGAIADAQWSGLYQVASGHLINETRLANRENFPSRATYLFRNLWGAVIATPARNLMTYNKTGYFGQYPLDQQPFLVKPKPWGDPTRSRG